MCGHSTLQTIHWIFFKCQSYWNEWEVLLDSCEVPILKWLAQMGVLVHCALLNQHNPSCASWDICTSFFIVHLPALGKNCTGFFQDRHFPKAFCWVPGTVGVKILEVKRSFSKQLSFCAILLFVILVSATMAVVVPVCVKALTVPRCDLCSSLTGKFCTDGHKSWHLIWWNTIASFNLLDLEQKHVLC